MGLGAVFNDNGRYLLLSFAVASPRFWRASICCVVRYMLVGSWMPYSQARFAAYCGSVASNLSSTLVDIGAEGRRALMGDFAAGSRAGRSHPFKTQ
jgi:hypothetical protein